MGLNWLQVPSKDLASSHYAEHDGKPFFPKLVNFLSSGPVVAMVRITMYFYSASVYPCFIWLDFAEICKDRLQGASSLAKGC